MTAKESATMSARKDNVLRQPLNRPPLTSQHSNSVPSTPHQHPRDFSAASRSPSPNGALGSHSPRSVSSEANSLLPALRKPRTGCRFETSQAFGRRRIPYSIGDAMLEKVKEEVKERLDPKEEEKLSGDMRELYDRILPTAESDQRRSQLVQKLERILLAEWPENEFKVHVFGSSGNMLCTSESDVDICIQTPMKKLETMHMLAEALSKHGMDRVVCVASAKVPIVKIWDPELRLSCDMNVNNTLALENTRMIKTYVQIDPRVRQLAMIIKYWTKQRILNDAALGGTLSSYTWICMILSFLQNRKPPILPSLHHSSARRTQKGETQSEFADDLDALQGFGDPNKESLGQLLFQFFRFYGHEMDYENLVISVRDGKLLSRREKGWHVDNLVKEGRNRLCVEEPFNVSRNLGNSADDTAFRGIHEEIRRAFDFLADGGQLDKACEQFEFPPEEKVTFKRPTATKTVLTHSAPSSTRGSRGNSNMRGGRGPSSLKGTHTYGRRASSGASFGNGRTPFLQSPTLGGPGQEYFVRGLHDHLFQQYQLLEMQQNNLKAQLFAQSQAQQAHAHAQLHAQAQAHQQTMANAQGRAGSINGSPQKHGYGMTSPGASENGPATAPLMPAYLYHYPMQYEHAIGMSQSLSQDGSRTTPSSPSLASTIPNLRRTVHRSSAASDTPTASIRSQSQPARGFPSPQMIPGYPVPAIPAEYFLRANVPTQPLAPEPKSQPGSTEVPQIPFKATPTLPPPALTADQGIPKEYVGYYMGKSPRGQSFAVPPIPPWSEIEGRQRQRRVSSEVSQTGSLLSGTMRKPSRSPSPLSGHFRSYSTGQGLRSAPLPGTIPLKPSRLDTVQTPIENGLLIMNGTQDLNMVNHPTNPPAVDENSGSTTTQSNGYGTPSTEVSPSDVPFNLDLPETRQHQLYANELLQRHKAAEASRSGVQNNMRYSGAATNGPTIVNSSSGQNTPSHPESSSFPVNGRFDMLPEFENKGLRRPQAPPNGISPIDIARTKEPLGYEPKSTGIGPLLSPVLETRTPSPTSNRVLEAKQQGNGKSILKSVPNGKVSKELPSSPLVPKTDADAKQPLKEAQSKKNGEQPPPRPTQAAPNVKSGSASQQNGTWQKSAPKKRKNKKSVNAKVDGEPSKGQGEPLPVNEAERKGG